MARIFAGGEEIPTKKELNRITDINLVSGEKWTNQTFGSGENGSLSLPSSHNRVMMFPIRLPNCKEITFDFTSLSNGAIWSYFFTKVPKSDVPNTFYGDPGWQFGITHETVKVPDGAKYLGVCIGGNENFTPDKVNQIADIKAWTQCTMENLYELIMSQKKD